MSDLYEQIPDSELIAPGGQYRVVMSDSPMPGSTRATHYLVGDFPEKEQALRARRDHYMQPHEDTKFTVFNDEGREVGIYGIVITEAERKAPKGKFRIVCADIAPAVANGTGPSFFLVKDMDDKGKALEVAQAENELDGPWSIGYQVFDDAGNALI